MSATAHPANDDGESDYPDEGTKAMNTELGQFAVTVVSPGYWRVTFSNPPINLQDPDTILELQELIGMIESEEELKVVVIDSAHPDFFINHYDVSRAAETPAPRRPTGLPTF